MLGFVTGVGRRLQETCRWNGRNGYGGMFNNRFLLLCLFFALTKVHGETRASGKHRDGCGDPRRIQDMVSVFYTPFSTVTLIF